MFITTSPDRYDYFRRIYETIKNRLVLIMFIFFSILSYPQNTYPVDDGAGRTPDAGPGGETGRWRTGRPAEPDDSAEELL